MTAITFTLHNGANVEHWMAETPEAALDIRNANNGWDSGWTFDKIADGYWHVKTRPEIALGQIPRVASQQFLGSATLSHTAPAGLVVFAGEYMSPSDAMALAGY